MEPNSEGTAQKKTVLVVEDDPEIATFLEIFLPKKGYPVCVARTGEDAINKYDKFQKENTPIHKILLDHNLNKYYPSITGLQVFEMLKQKYNLSADYIKEKIIFTSSDALSDNAVVEQAKKLGIEIIIPKPLNLEILLKELENSPVCPAPVDIGAEKSKCDYAITAQPPQTL